LREPGIVRAGSAASLSVHAAPGAACSIAVTYPDGPSRAAGLATKGADAAGDVVWSWMVDASAPTGVWATKVSCGGQSATTYLYVP
jgi:hypothetical protein